LNDDRHVELLREPAGEVRWVRLTLKEGTTLPIEADCISPDRFVGRSRAEIEALPVFHGRREVPLGELFAVEGEDGDHIALHGDLRHVKRVGEGMSGGRIRIHGDVGMHVGSGMRGGEIVVHGDADAWAGAHMAGGVLWIHGDAGSMLGAAYAGEKRGMKGGVLLVDGDAGPRAGERMRRGIIVVQGDLGEFAGVRMIAGSIFVFGTLGPRVGAGMKRGTIVTMRGLTAGLLPTFRYACIYSPDFMRYYLRRLQAWGLPVTQEQIEGRYRRYSGDITTIGLGEVFVYDSHQ
jgi:formylmethanofuran dehydrogenase subunit C